MEAPHAETAAPLGAGARRALRRLVVGAIAALGLTALAAPAALANFTPEGGGYIDHSTSNGHRLTFHYAGDTGTVHDFTLSSNTIFSSATVHHTTDGWRFTHYDSHYIVHGTWLNHWTVHGSICNLHIDPTGCRTSGKQSFEAVLPNAKPIEGPWIGTASAGQDVVFSLGPSLTGSGALVMFDLWILPAGSTPSFETYDLFIGRQALGRNSEGAWHFSYEAEFHQTVGATWTDPAHMHGHACRHIPAGITGGGTCDPNRTWTFTAHSVHSVG
jgi:hypothetical protein